MDMDTTFKPNKSLIANNLTDINIKYINPKCDIISKTNLLGKFKLSAFKFLTLVQSSNLVVAYCG